MDNQGYILRMVDTKIDESFLLAGSAPSNHKGILHSGAGRIAKLRCARCLYINLGILPAKYRRKRCAMAS